MTDQVEKPTTFEYEGGVYEVGRDTIRARMTSARVRQLTIQDSKDPDVDRYFRMFHQLINNTRHVSGEHSLPLVDLDVMKASDPIITDTWEAFLLIDPYGWENSFWEAWWNANPSVNRWAATPTAFLELLETEEKKTGTEG